MQIFKRVLVLNLLAVSLGLAAVSAHATAEGEKCLKRLIDAGCSLNGYGSDILNNTKECKQLVSSSGNTTLQVLVMKSGLVMTVQTEGQPRRGSACPSRRMDLEARAGIDDVIIMDVNKAWLHSTDGSAYIVYPDSSVYELLNTSKEAYKGIGKIAGIANGKAVQFQYKNGNPMKGNEYIDSDEIESRRKAGRVQKVEFIEFSWQSALRSLFQ